MDTSTLLSQAHELIVIDLQQCEYEYNELEDKFSLNGRIIESLIRERRKWIKEYNMREGIGCSECGSENLGNDETICKECKDKSRELAYN